MKLRNSATKHFVNGEPANCSSPLERCACVITMLQHEHKINSTRITVSRVNISVKATLSLVLSLSLSHYILTAIFQVNLGLSVFIEAKDDGGGGDNWTTFTGAISRAKLQSNHHHRQTNIHFLQAGCPSCRPTNSVKALMGKITYHKTCLPQAHLEVFQL